MGAYSSEWLVSDQRGAFAMGTPDGIRTRKYHGFYLGIPGRSETSFLTELEMTCNGVPLWQHEYGSPQGPLRSPDLEAEGHEPKYLLTSHGPEWKWMLDGGVLTFGVEAVAPGGIGLRWKWYSRSKKPAVLRVRGFCGMRDLHSLGGRHWNLSLWNQEPGREIRATLAADSSPSLLNSEIHCLLRGPWTWDEEPVWHQNFHYSEEIERGYPANEDLFSAGVLEITLQKDPDGVRECAVLISEDPSVFDQNPLFLSDLRQRASAGPRPKLFDFVLKEPAGIVAGFPWFGEWGRDTFVALPGVIASSLMTGEGSAHLDDWVYELMNRWGNWILEKGRLPNFIEKSGNQQWESADATLWWCHSLASIWMYSLVNEKHFQSIRQDFSRMLDAAVHAIRTGKHTFLRENQEGLLLVTESHSTWMDAKVNGQPASPRLGCLPEINALWFEARCLQWLWSDNKNFQELEELGRRVLRCREPERPNTVFLHSIPLAPSFVLKDWNSLEEDLLAIAEKLWTPVGLRTLSPTHPDFKRHCVGDQSQRDLAYHQGPPWGWLGGQFEAARHRMLYESSGDTTRFDHSSYDKMFTPEILNDMPILGHIAELFDAVPPFTPRGAPAQAWSLACFEETKARRRLKVDLKITNEIARELEKEKEGD